MEGVGTYFLLLLVFPFATATSNVEETRNNSSQENCAFPAFFQTPCMNSLQVCHWSQGKHFSKKETSSHKSKLNEIYSDWRWVVNESNISVSTGLDTQGDGQHKSLTCIKQVGSNKFIFSLVHSLNPKIIKHSCMKLIQRGENVVEFKMSNLSSNVSEELCKEETLSEKGLLMADKFKEVADCPLDLLGGFAIERVYDSKQRDYCVIPEGAQGVFETDCIQKEGIFIDLPGTQNCSFEKFLGHFENKHLHCYSQEWRDEDFSYFITKRRFRSSYDVRREARESEFQCLKYKRNRNGEDITLYLYKDPICDQGKESEPQDRYILYLRKSTTVYHNANIMKSKCAFSKELQGQWLEKSRHFGDKSVNISSKSIEIPKTGLFVCGETFEGISYRRCLADYSRAWPEPGRLRYFDNEYMLVSRTNNGCRERMTRLAVKSWTNSHLVYRLSQSQPIRRINGVTPEKFYKRELFYFCEYKFFFSLDPGPYWGRNIEKVITKSPLKKDRFSECPVLKSKCGFQSVLFDGKTCNGTISTSSSGIELVYQPRCSASTVSYRCLKQESEDNTKYGSFSLIQNSRGQVFCIHQYYDRAQKHDVILRLDSPQCSDIDWTIAANGKSAWHEKLTLYEVCESSKKAPITEQPKISEGKPTTITEDNPISTATAPDTNSDLDVKMLGKRSLGAATSCPNKRLILVLFLMVLATMASL